MFLKIRDKSVHFIFAKEVDHFHLVQPTSSAPGGCVQGGAQLPQNKAKVSAKPSER